MTHFSPSTAKRHPWVDRFILDPDQELVEFLAGYARIEPYGRAERPDAARLLFQDDPQALALLDEAVGRFLRHERLAGVPKATPATLNRKLLQVMDALRLVSLLKLHDTALSLRKGFSLWRSWIDRLPSSADVDVRAQYLSTLALTQRLLQDVTDLNRSALEPYWISVCEQAGRMLPESYLQIGLLGLRFLPERAGAPNERPWMTGLARWATVRRPPLKIFSQQWLALKRLYPRAPVYWRAAVAGTLRQRFLRAMPGEIEGYWREDVGLDRTDINERAPKRATILPPPKESIDAILNRAAEPLSKFILEANRFISQVEHFAEVTGESHYLVRSACNLGMRLLELGPSEEHSERGGLAVRLARKALNWQPDDMIVWALWRDGLEAEGRLRAAEFVGWEAIRRFPEDPQRRNQLASLLGRIPGRSADSERLMRETLQRFPSDAVAAHQLASFLAKRPEGVREAETLWRSLIADNPEDLAAHRALEKLVATKIAAGPTPLSDLAPQSSGVSETHENPDGEDGDGLFATVMRGGRLRRMAAYMGWNHISNEHALAEVREILSADPNSPYARYLHDHLTGDATTETNLELGSFGVAFAEALRKADRSGLSALEEHYPDPRQLYDMARVILSGDIDAARETTEWLSRRSVGEPRPVVALRRFLKRRLDGAAGDALDGFVIDDLERFLNIVAANDNIRLDLMEAALAPWDLALAA